MMKINYLEYASENLPATKSFFSAAFEWLFTDYGPEYVAFKEPSGMDGGFYKSVSVAKSEQGAPLTVFYAKDLEAALDKVEQSGGKISKAIFSFPGGRRFHFIEPGGNEFAIWSEDN
jgi:predicted enzyme related to lactoylglutathione lyase